MFYVKVTKCEGYDPVYQFSFQVPGRDGDLVQRSLLAPEITPYDFRAFRRGEVNFYLAFENIMAAKGGDYYRIYGVQTNDLRRSYYTYLAAARIFINLYPTSELKHILEENCSLKREITPAEDRLWDLYPKARGSRFSSPLESDGASVKSGEIFRSLKAAESARVRSDRERRAAESARVRSDREHRAAEPVRVRSDRSHRVGAETDETVFARSVARQEVAKKTWQAQEEDRKKSVVSKNRFAALAE